ncbi:MAG: tetratricopeptide repeat protein [Bacteroidetes bacterium]|nr:MAG: tetratricopeptide repeat protein [Bacteroidota bacterium]TAG85618.1 MAG: tetratricopeptide repeat protein [Bacteroidota bacterium]
MKLSFTSFVILLIFFTFLVIDVCIAQSKFERKEYYENLIQKFDKASSIANKTKILEMACDTSIHYEIDTKQNEKMLLYFFKYLSKNNQKISYKLYVSLGIHYKYQNLGKTLAIDYFLKALQNSEAKENLYLLTTIKMYLGNLFYQINDFEEAKKYLLEVKKYNHLLDKKSNWKNYNTLALIYYKINQYEEAKKYYEKSLQHAIEYKDKVWIGLIKGNLGTLYYKEKKYEKALELLEIDVNTSIEFDNIANAIISLTDMISIYIEKNDLENADKNIAKGFDLLSKLKQKDKLNDIHSYFSFYDCVSLYHKTKKDFEKALDYKEKAENLLKQYDSFIKKQKIEELKFQYAHKTDILETSELAKQNKIQQITLYLVISVLVLLFLLILLITQKYIANKKNNQLLKAQKQQITGQADILSQQNMKIKLQNQNLEVLNQTKNKLFSLVAHDLRSPLISLKGILDLLKDNNLTFEEVKNFIPMLNSNMEKTLTLTEDLLYWGQTQLEGLVLIIEKINLNEVVAAKAKKFSDFAYLDKKIKFEINTDDKIKNVLADKDMLLVIFRNLITNAIKFSDDGSKITLSTKMSEDQKFAICGVSDTGVGISEQNIDRIFSGTIFTTKGTKGERGTGFGLMLCKDFVDLHGGKIWIESELGKGSTFYFTMPIEN